MSETNKRVRSNLHHTQFYRRVHNSMAYTKKIRDDERLIVPLELDAHDELHKQVTLVPPMSHNLARAAFYLYKDIPDANEPLENLENYMQVIETAIKNPRVSELEKRMAELTVLACDMQRPFIKEGYVDLSKYRRTA